MEETKEETEPLLENAYPEVNELITEYYAALQSKDLETVKALFDYSEDKELLRMQENSSHIESYNNIVCYTKSGLEPDSYVVYACYDVKFVGFDTLVPGLTPFYVSKNAEGSFYIHDWEHDPRGGRLFQRSYGAGGCHCTVRQNQDRSGREESGGRSAFRHSWQAMWMI